jgi:hypothetical protein
MSSRKKITKFCEEHGIVIVELHYVRDFVPVPEERVPVGWVAYVHPVSNADDVFEFTGSVDDLIFQLSKLIGYSESDWYMSYGVDE